MDQELRAELEIDDETLALDLIDEIGPDGQFLETEHTRRHYRERWYPKLFERDNYDRWVAKGSKTTGGASLRARRQAAWRLTSRVSLPVRCGASDPCHRGAGGGRDGRGGDRMIGNGRGPAPSAGLAIHRDFDRGGAAHPRGTHSRCSRHRREECRRRRRWISSPGQALMSATATGCASRPKLVEQAIACAPKSVTLYDRNGAPAIRPRRLPQLLRARVGLLEHRRPPDGHPAQSGVAGRGRWHNRMRCPPEHGLRHVHVYARRRQRRNSGPVPDGGDAELHHQAHRLHQLRLPRLRALHRNGRVGRRFGRSPAQEAVCRGVRQYHDRSAAQRRICAQNPLPGPQGAALCDRVGRLGWVDRAHDRSGDMVVRQAGSLTELVLAQLVRPGTPAIIAGSVDGSLDMRSMILPYAEPEPRACPKTWPAPWGCLSSRPAA